MDKPIWQQILKNAQRNPRQLIKELQIDSHQLSIDPEPHFPLLVPPGWMERMEKGNPNDPLLLQVLSTVQENDTNVGSVDPLHEQEQSPIPGMIHKYKNRILLIAAGGCAIHCRYCFRRHFPYHHHNLDINAILEYINDRPDIDEIILSGGDPLMLNDHSLKNLLHRLAQAKSIKRLRIHTRLPTLIPERLTNDLIDMLHKSPFGIYMVLHINHPNEIDPKVGQALRSLIPQIKLYNQSVLLRGINDDAQILKILSLKLLEWNIQPYYLHQLDAVQGAEHFRVPLNKAQKIYRTLQAITSGYAVPKWVQEEPFVPHKSQIISSQN